MNLFLLAVVLTCCLAQQGNLVLIGGGDKTKDIMNKFIELSGGREKLITFITTASGDPTAPEYYYKLFRETYRCSNVIHLNITRREHASNERYVTLVKKSSGIFFSGGDQNRLYDSILGTPVGNQIKRSFFENKLTVGGTSAGTAFQSEIMLTGKGDLKVIKKRNIETTKGLGLLKNIIIDQHFIERQRQNRLISTLIENEKYFGVGIGEATAAVFLPNNIMKVVGDGWVQIYDTTKLQTRIDRTSNNIGGFNFKMHILRNGESFNITSMKPFV